MVFFLFLVDLGIEVWMGIKFVFCMFFFLLGRGFVIFVEFFVFLFIFIVFFIFLVLILGLNFWVILWNEVVGFFVKGWVGLKGGVVVDILEDFWGGMVVVLVVCCLGGVFEEGVFDILNSFVWCGKMREIKVWG